MNYGIEGGIKQTGEMNALKYVKRKLKHKKNPVLLDVGANIGDYSIELNQHFGPDSIIHSFEPLSSTFLKLQKNTQEYLNIRVHNLAVGFQNSTQIIHFDNFGNIGQASIIHHDLAHFHRTIDQTEQIQVINLKTFTAKEKIDHIDFLKIDVEGYELEVLKGAEELILKGKISYIQLEFGATYIDAGVFFKDVWKLLSHNYHIYRILRHSLVPIHNYTESLEVFHFSNFLAEKK